MKEEIFKRLDALADKLGVAASYLFKLYVQQAKVEAVTDFLLLLVALALGYGGFKSMQYGFNSEDNEKGIPFILTGAIAATIAGIVILCFLFSDVWTAMMNPQFWAIHQIIKDIKGGQ